MTCAVPVLAQAGDKPITVACASALRFAMPDLIQAWHEQSSVPIRVVYGSSGNLSRQIQQGAPFDLFLAANEAYVLRLYQAGLTEDEGEVYATGQLVLMYAKRSSWQLTSIRDLTELLQAGQIQAVAMATPAHAPYGQRAQEALESAGVAAELAQNLVFGDSVSQAGQFVLSGAAEVGIVSKSLAVAPFLKDRMQFTPVPKPLHQPLTHRMVRLAHAQAGNRIESVDLFYRFLTSATARQVFERHGFE